MKKIFSSNRALVVLAICLLTTFTCCTKWDDFKAYTANGEHIYAAKLDSVKIFSGKERVKIYGILKSDPKLKTCKIYWNNFKDSVIIDISQRRSENRLEYILPLPEGSRNFVIVNYDNDGNASLFVRANGISYGNGYRSRLSNRPITSVVYTASNNRSTINWDVIDNTVGAQYVEIEYPIGGAVKQTPISESITNLDGFNTNIAKFRYRTIFRPDASCIDTFEVAHTIR